MDGFYSFDRTEILARPLVRRVWVPLPSATRDLSLLEAKLDRSIEHSRCWLDFYVCLWVGNGNSLSLAVALRTAIGAVRRLKIGEEKSYPNIGIYLPLLCIASSLLETIQELDVYNPPIKVFGVIDVTAAPTHDLMKFASRASNALYEHVIDHNFVVYANGEPGSVASAIEATRLLLQNQEIIDRLPGHGPIIELSPYCFPSNYRGVAAELALLFTESPRIVRQQSFGPCGLCQIAFRVKESLLQQDSLSPLVPIPTFPCGVWAGEGSCLEPECERIVGPCLYALRKTLVSRMAAIARCHSCKYVRSCLGCAVPTSQSWENCNIALFIDAFKKSLEANPKVLQLLAVPEPKVGILELDWDYIYDGLADVSYKRSELH